MTTLAGFTLTTTVRMVDGVHDCTTNCRFDTQETTESSTREMGSVVSVIIDGVEVARMGVRL
jgi:hypothetical protein